MQEKNIENIYFLSKEVSIKQIKMMGHHLYLYNQHSLLQYVLNLDVFCSGDNFNFYPSVHLTMLF
jgi:hypothetical protein